MQTLYVATNGNDAWSGTLETPNAAGTDGPLAGIEKARNLIREWKRTGRLSGAVTVQIRGGVYPLAAPLLFTPEDSAPVTYTAYPGETPIFDGGVRITGWRVEEVNGHPCWVTEAPDAGYFRSLFVNGERRSRPRLPKEGFYRIASAPVGRGSETFTCHPGDIQNWQNLTDVDVVVLHLWVDEHMPLASFDAATCTVTSSRRSVFQLKEDWRVLFAPYYVENVFEALTEPGEWYLDRGTGKLYYLPLPGEDPETAEVYAPKLTQLLQVNGLPAEGHYVEFLRFEGLTFRHADAELPGGKDDLFTRLNLDESVVYASAPQAANHVP
ncbi:MAG TPA: hypothetical protein VGM23_16340, partial [Armatimonadota bacterium]